MLRSIFLTFLLFALPISSNAGIAQVPVTSYTGLNFNITNMTAAGFGSDCTSLYLDVAGAIANSGRFTVYGSLNCTATQTSYVSTGAGYLSTVGTLEITNFIGNIRLLCTVSTSTWSGTCSTYNLSNIRLGTGTVTYLP